MDEKTERHPEVGIMASGCLLTGIIYALKKTHLRFGKTSLCFHSNALVFEVKRTCVSGKT